MKKFSLLGLLILVAFPAHAGPSVFVRGEQGMAWWNRDMEARIIGRQAGDVTAKQVSDFLAETMIYSPYDICSLEAVDATTFVGIDKSTQEDINSTLPHVSWRQDGKAPNGRQIVGQIVVFESCFVDDPRGAALLVTDKQTREILRWEPIGDSIDEKGERQPTWVMFMMAGGEEALFAYSGCTECGARTSVYYDVTRNKIYTEYNGH
jgi:hypothetical protein